MSILRRIAYFAFGLTLISSATDALAQGFKTKKPRVGERPLLQIRPSPPMGCKLVGTVRGTKLWAGECIAAPELRKTEPQEVTPPRPPETETAPKDQQ